MDSLSPGKNFPRRVAEIRSGMLAAYQVIRVFNATA
jgi:hypothetical protein